MKRFLAAFALTLSTSVALACPDLTGTYMCPGENEGEMVETAVSQAVVNGATVYTVTDASGPIEFIADGQPRTAQEDHQDYILLYTSTNTCNGSASLNARTDVSAYLKANQQVVQLGLVDLDIAKDASGSLLMSGTATQSDGTTENISSACTKK